MEVRLRCSGAYSDIEGLLVKGMETIAAEKLGYTNHLARLTLCTL